MKNQFLPGQQQRKSILSDWAAGGKIWEKGKKGAGGRRAGRLGWHIFAAALRREMRFS
ncbi:MAG: hypothetical protein HFI04_06540 [Lachnospiraceae bacterium]|jgi:hypothetical protein|nr:hypothetical protein [Lachnospiraceae bacterium]